MNRYKVKALTEAGVGTLLSLVMVVIGLFVPSLLMPSIFLAGIPMMYLGLRRGLRVLCASFVGSVLVLIAVSGNPLGGILTGIMAFLPGLVLGRTLRIRKTFAAIIFSGAAVVLFGTVLQLAVLNVMGDGHGIADMVNQALEGVRQNLTEVFAALEGQFPADEQELQAMLNQVIDLTRETIFLYLPSFLIGSAVVMSYLLFMVSAFFLHRTRPVRIVYQPFWGICASKPIFYVGAALFLLTAFSESNSVWMAALRNMAVLMYAYFVVCGVSFVDYKFRKRIPSGYVRGIIYCMVLVIGYLFLEVIIQSMCILGVLDGVAEFRIREERMRHE